MHLITTLMQLANDYPLSLSETPGGVYAVAYVLGSLLFIIVNKKKFKILPLIGITIIFTAILVLFMELNHPVPAIWFMPSIMAYILVMFTYIFIAMDVPIKSVIYYTARAFIVGEFIGSLSWQLYYFSITNTFVAHNIWVLILFIVTIEGVVFALLWVLEQRFKEEARDFTLNRRELISTIIIVIAVFAVSNLSYVYDNTPFSGQVAEEIFNVRTWVDFGGVALLFAFHIQITELHMKFEVGKLQNLLKLQVENYEMSKHSIELVNQKYHDLKHHIAAMKATATDEYSLDHLNELEKEIKIFEAQNKTGNHVLDTILSARSVTCQARNIQMNVIADGHLLERVDVIDISILFGNLLDNAIESVKNINEKERKLIYLSISRQRGFILIHLENPFVGDIRYKNGLPMTTKKDQLNHGYGLKSVQTIVKKYDGSLTITNDDKWFEVRILLPIIS